jgi:hypothetical protein
MNSQLPRRSMSEGLQTASLSPEAISLIREGRPSPIAANPIIAQVELKSAPTPSEFPKAQNKTELPRSERIQEEKETKPRLTKDVSIRPAEGTVSRSFRLPESLPPTLLRAATERRINRTPPCTQEEIVAEAITQWLKKNGHLL